MVDGSAKGMPPPDAVEQVDRDEPEAAVFDAVIVTGPLVRLAAALVAGLLLCASFPLLDCGGLRLSRSRCWAGC
jgi:hypothetical protein